MKNIEDINKLPKWAKFKIEKLEGDLSYYKDIYKEIKGEKKTNVFIDNGIDSPIPLPNNTKIIFSIGEDRIVVGHRYKEPLRLDAMSLYGSLMIVPRASNVALFSVVRD